MAQIAEQTMPPQPAGSSNFMGFAIKVAIVTIAIALGATYIADAILESVVATVKLQSFKESIRKSARDEKTRVRLTGLLTHNPAVHWRVAAIEESNGNIGAAITEIELALGLLEVNAVDRATREKYQSRLEDLKRKQKVPPEWSKPGTGTKR